MTDIHNATKIQEVMEEEYERDYENGRKTFARAYAESSALGDFETALTTAKLSAELRYRNYPHCKETMERMLAYVMGRMMGWKETQEKKNERD